MNARQTCPLCRSRQTLFSYAGFLLTWVAAWEGLLRHFRETAFPARARLGCGFAALCGLLLSLPEPAMAQFKVQISLKYSEFVQYEPLSVKVVLENRDARPFVVARDVTPLPELKLLFERQGLNEVRRRKEGMLLRDLYVLPGKQEELEINAAEWYDVSSTGQYLMKAVVKWGDREYTSNPVVFEMVPGVPLSRTVQAVPGDPERLRTYTLRYWRREKGEHLFLSVSEEDSKVSFGTFPLGGLLRVHKPTIDIDAEGKVKIRHQVSPTCFAHTTFESTATGIRFVKQSFHLENGDPYPTVESSGAEKSR